MEKQGDLIFTLDIGTRTVIGLVLEYRDNKYQILASQVEEHQERAMLDGQIHNVREVARQVKIVKEKLEKKLKIELERVAIAAAGRALKTVEASNKIKFEGKKVITREDVQHLEYGAIQKAQASFDEDYHFVGYSVVEYLLDGMLLGELEGQRGKRLEVSLIATFLPRIVVDSLLTVVNRAGLEVSYLTLEPIAAANLVIPRDMYNFNIALIDIGAGTSDIALTKGGRMIGYAMVPLAGDEVSESLAEHYLLDYKNGEKLKRHLGKEEAELSFKNILSQEITVSTEEAKEVIKPVVQTLASQISEAILSINQKAPQVVICIGGGSLTPNLLGELANFLDIDENRVGIKESSDIKEVQGQVEGVNDAQTITPIAIAVSSHQQEDQSNFLDVTVNDQHVQLFALNKASVLDALLAADIDHKKLQGKPGMGITCTVNGELKAIKGSIGKPGKVLLNGEEVDLKTHIKNGDNIQFIPGKDGEDASAMIRDVLPALKSYDLIVNGSKVKVAPHVYQNGKLVDINQPLEDGADIKYTELKNLKDAISLLYEVKPEKIKNEYLEYKLNGQKRYWPEDEFLILAEGKPAHLNKPLVDGLEIEVKKREEKKLTLQKIKKQNKLKVRFNGSPLEVPAGCKFYVNGELAKLEYEINNGDEIECKEKPVTVRYLLDYINYRVSSAFDNFKLTINEQGADLDDIVKSGDKIRISLAKG